MAIAKTARTRVEVSQREKVTYTERTMLWGLVKWWVRVSSEKVGDDLHITTDLTIDAIYLNGVKISK